MKKREAVFTLLGVIAIIFALLAFSKPRLKRWTESVSCGNYMSSISFGATMWADDNDGRMPTDFLSMSNILDTPQVLICPGDHTRQAATNWASFTMANASYKIIAPSISESDTNIAWLQCIFHTNHFGYVHGYVFDGRRMRTKSLLW